MRPVSRLTPAFFRRAFFFWVLLVALCPLWAAGPAPRPPELSQAGKPDDAEAARLIEQFRGAGLPGDSFLEFELIGLPRRGEGVTLRGRWWGSRNPQGSVSRIEVTDAQGQPHRFVLQNGDDAAVWRMGPAGPVRLGVEDVLSPLVPGVEVTAFDLQMPFLYWKGASVEKITRVLGRPAHSFLFPAPPGFAVGQADIGAARAYLDTQFNVPMQTEVISRAGRVTRTLELLSLKTVERQTLPKAADYRNEVTRDKTRLLVRAAALNLQFPTSLFDPATLGEPAVTPAADRLVRLDP